MVDDARDLLFVPLHARFDEVFEWLQVPSRDHPALSRDSRVSANWKGEDEVYSSAEQVP